MKFKKRGYKLFLGSLFTFALIKRYIKYKRLTSGIGIILSTFILWFHRNPQRTPESSTGYISPIDGRIEKIECKENEIFISVYLGLKDVHSVRSPIDGTISSIDRTNGYNFPALITELSEKNNSLSFEYSNGDIITIYTGILARRLISETVENESVETGDEIGFISFGSRGTITIKKKNLKDIKVSEGDKIYSGETLIASNTKS
jgi:phosphatidylserine decarboxylase